jgi:hypothetical protein
MAPGSVDLGLGPDAQLLALSSFPTVPGPGVAVVDLNGNGMIYTQQTWMDAEGRITDENGSGGSGVGTSMGLGAVFVTGQAPEDCQTVVVQARVPGSEPMECTASTEAGGWYAVACPIREPWPDDLDKIDVRILHR